MGCESIKINSEIDHRYGRYRCKICKKLKLDHIPCKCKYPDFERIGINQGNTHPCIKPLSLMKYLCTLTKTPTGGAVLDPFAGSGTTGLACIETGRPYVLIEQEAEYCQISNARLEKAERHKLAIGEQTGF
jgi:DNA modification methylase